MPIEMKLVKQDNAYYLANPEGKVMKPRHIKRALKKAIKKGEELEVIVPDGLPKHSAKKYFSRAVGMENAKDRLATLTRWLGGGVGAISPALSVLGINLWGRREFCVEKEYVEECIAWDSDGCYGWGGYDVCLETAREPLIDAINHHWYFSYGSLVLLALGVGLVANRIRYNKMRKNIANQLSHSSAFIHKGKTVEIKYIPEGRVRKPGVRKTDQLQFESWESPSEQSWEDYSGQGLETRVDASAWSYQQEDPNVYQEHYAGYSSRADETAEHYSESAEWAYESAEAPEPSIGPAEMQKLEELGSKLNAPPKLGESPQDYKARLESLVQQEREEILQKVRSIERKLNGETNK